MRYATPLAIILILAACSGPADGGGATEEAGESPDRREAPSTSEEAPTTAEATTSSTEAAPTATSRQSGSETPDLSATDLLGRWAHYDVVAYEDGQIKSLIVSYGFNDFTAQGDQIIDTASFCFSEQVTDQPFESALSDEGTQAIKPPPTPLQVEETEGEIRIYRPPSPTPVGIRLDDPASESLPTDPGDPRIVDDDGDGNPGVTVSIEAGGFLGELYIARREIFSYNAVLTPDEPDVITGQVTDESEQLIIGASNELFLVENSTFVQHPDLGKSPIVLRRVDTEWDCDRLAAEREDLFPPTPVVDW